MKRGFSQLVKRQARERAGYKSEISGRSGVLHVDHKQPKGKGGSNDLDNAQVLTIDEHDRKHQIEDGYSPADYYRWMTFQRSFFYDLFSDQPD